MTYFYLLVEFAKVFNWTQRVLEVRVVAGWPTSNDPPLLDKKIRGELQDECLKFKMPLKLQVLKPSQTLKIQVSTGAGRNMGSADLVLDANTTKQKIHYLPLAGSDNKILQVNISIDLDPPRTKTPSKDIVLECERVVHETLQRKIITNMELKRNDEFIRNREKFLTEYSRSKSRSQTKDFPSKINNLLQEVRDIKNAIRQSSSRSNSRVTIGRESAQTPTRLSSLHSIEERPKSRMFHRSPKEQPPLAVRSPRRIYGDARRFPTQTPAVYNEYGFSNGRIFQERAVKMPVQHDRNSRAGTPQQRNGRVPMPQEERHIRQPDRAKGEQRLSEKYKDRSKDRQQLQHPIGNIRKPY